MDYKFLNKVVDQILSETRIDYDKEKLHTPFPNNLNKYLLIFGLPSSYFTQHCKEVYGLNYDEVNYVWDEYKNIITNKIR